MKYANAHLYTDVIPFEIVGTRGKKTILVREMNSILSEDFKPKMISGGFSGHTVNNYDQTYTYESNENNPILRARLHKDGFYYSKMGKHHLSDKPRRFCDYNF